MLTSSAESAKMKLCRYCKKEALLLSIGDIGYPYQSDYGPVYICIPCGAWVGCHKGTTKALGGLANAELRKAKMEAHAAFDPLWQRKMVRDQCGKKEARTAGYKWLSCQLGIPFEKTHIGYMTLAECEKVIEICTALRG